MAAELATFPSVMWGKYGTGDIPILIYGNHQQSGRAYYDHSNAIIRFSQTTCRIISQYPQEIGSKRLPT